MTRPKAIGLAGKTKIGALLVPGNKGTWPHVRGRPNSLLVGWSACFGYGTRAPAYRHVL